MKLRITSGSRKNLTLEFAIVYILCLLIPHWSRYSTWCLQRKLNSECFRIQPIHTNGVWELIHPGFVTTQGRFRVRSIVHGSWTSLSEGLYNLWNSQCFRIQKIDIFVSAPFLYESWNNSSHIKFVFGKWMLSQSKGAVSKLKTKIFI